MNVDHSFGWGTLLFLGALHGINPAMGWLFAVSLGLQEGSGRAVWWSLGPLALGHAMAIAAALLAAAALNLVVPLAALKWIAAVALVTAGVSHLLRHRHPRRGGMRIGPKDLAIWSFLVASAHGAGLMALPFVLGISSQPAGMADHGHVAMAGLGGGGAAGLLATGLHTAGYLLVAGTVALVVYHKLGLRLLRSAWINIDLIWAAALVLTGILTPFL
jgi:hypothetical protein